MYIYRPYPFKSCFSMQPVNGNGWQSSEYIARSDINELVARTGMFSYEVANVNTNLDYNLPLYTVYEIANNSFFITGNTNIWIKKEGYKDALYDESINCSIFIDISNRDDSNANNIELRIKENEIWPSYLTEHIEDGTTAEFLFAQLTDDNYGEFSIMPMLNYNEYYKTSTPSLFSVPGTINKIFDEYQETMWYFSSNEYNRNNCRQIKTDINKLYNEPWNIKNNLGSILALDEYDDDYRIITIADNSTQDYYMSSYMVMGMLINPTF